MGLPVSTRRGRTPSVTRFGRLAATPSPLPRGPASTGLSVRFPAGVFVPSIPAVDDLIRRLQARAADRERRTDVRVSVFDNTFRTLDLGSLLSMGRSLGGDL